MKIKSQAATLFDAECTYELLKEDTDRMLISIMNFDPNDVNTWKFEDIWYDSYDSSFEFGGCAVDFVPTPDQLKKVWELGFFGGWINYTDGTQRHAGKESNKIGRLYPQTNESRSNPHPYLKKIRQLQREVNELRDQLENPLYL